jgi:asparagine synthase (glutamine-hydrolysing)
MCGVIGIISSESRQEITDSADKMLRFIDHRGPDGRGLEVFNLPKAQHLALGHNRLAIIDTTDAGLMPMSNADDSLSIIFNGEIFNYIELKEELASLGYCFTTNTDTEVLLNAYSEWGSDCLNKLNGMFAFAIFNKVNSELFIARDRYGVKPLYYFFQDNLFIFASEIKSILTHQNVDVAPEEEMLGKFLLTGAVNNTNLTCFSGIYSLSPGYSLKMQQGKLTTDKWYSPIKNLLSSDPNYNYQKSLGDFQDIFHDAVKLRLRSDVEVGACLSGGLDSSAIVGAVANISSDMSNPGSFKTFSSVYDDPKISEIEYVDEVTKFTNTTNFSFTPQLDAFWENIPKIIWHNDEPIQTPTTFNQWSVMEAAKNQSIKVTLDGQGVDELAAGYPTYFSIHLAELARKLNVIEFITTFKDIVSTKGEGRNTVSLLFRVIYLLIPQWAISALSAIPFFRFVVKGESFQPILRKKYKQSWRNIAKHQLLLQRKHSISIAKRLRFDFYNMSLPALLRYEDRSSMAFSIEARTPFLDYRLVEFIQSLPSEYFIKEGLTKAIVRDGVSSLIPQSVFNRTDKKGYPIPSSDWLNKSDKIIKNIFSGETFLSTYINIDEFQKMLSLGKLPIKDDELWRLVFAELWFREFFQKDPQNGKLTKHSRFSQQ